jgi:hypothetical protein
MPRSDRRLQYGRHSRVRERGADVSRTVHCIGDRLERRIFLHGSEDGIYLVEGSVRVSGSRSRLDFGLAYRFLQKSYVFYAGRPLPCFNDDASLRRFLVASPYAYVFVNTESLAELEAAFPGQFEVLIRQRRFLRQEDVFVLAHRGPSGAGHTATIPTTRDTARRAAGSSLPR